MNIVEKEIEIEVLTGLRIGGEKESFEVGGLDNTVIKIVYYDKERRVPIIPGSSLKGRMSMLLEKEYDVPYLDDEEKIKNGEKGMPIRSKEDLNKTNKKWEELSEEAKRILSLFRSFDGVKLIFSDLLPSKETLEMWRELEDKELTYDFGTEIKTENVINRAEGKAKHPRKMERVVKGSKFVGTITLIYENEEDMRKNQNKDLEILEKGCELIAKTYLGGSGSRGYGRVKIKFNGKEFKPSNLE
jgi:CRISPR-associated protein Csm3